MDHVPHKKVHNIEDLGIVKGLPNYITQLTVP